MLCSAAELGIGDDASGIMELSGDFAVGVGLSTALDLDDHVIELDLTPNRGDCLGVRGIAREIAVRNAMALSVPAIPAVPAQHDASFPVRLHDPVGCPRYLGRVIHGITPGAPTPQWLQERLRRSGLRPIDAVVDVTNYVMLELGQPMHAFDLNVLRDGITVRRARSGESLELLDGRTLELDEKTLLICDGMGPVAIAGVMGGQRSGIQAHTRDVFLECAFFAPAVIAGTARRYGMQTDAAQRFERGVDWQLQFAAMERATALLLEIVGGRPGPVVDTADESYLPRRHTVTLRQARLNTFVGAQIDSEDVERILERLDFAMLECTGVGERRVWTFAVPSHRFDIAREVDLIEEVIRIRGYDSVPARSPATHLTLSSVPLDRTPKSRIRSLMVDLGYQELITYSFIDPGLQDLLDPGAPVLTLANPMSQEMAVLRTNLLSGLVAALRTNEARQATRARLFEIGCCFAPGVDEPVQTMRIAGLISGDRMPLNWTQPETEADFFDLKGDVERLLTLGGRAAVTFSMVSDPVLHPGRAAQIMVDGRAIGRLGQVHPELQRRLDLRRPAFVFELDVEAVAPSVRRKAAPVSRYPSVRRDIAVVVTRDVSAARLEACVRQAAAETLVDFRLFDVYHGEGIDSNKKSVALGLTFQNPTRTLTEGEINALMDAVVGALEKDLGARLR
jgi:phenylalanyl-tRNA synthetase beta chain